MSGGQSSSNCEMPGEHRLSSKGHCRACRLRQLWRDPEFRARQNEARKEMWSRPEFRARQRELNRQKLKAWQANPENREIIRLNALRALKKATTPEAIAKRNKTIGARIRQGHNPWCPPHYLEAYSIARKKLGAAEARALIENQIAWDADAGKREVARRAAEMEAKHRRDLEQRY